VTDSKAAGIHLGRRRLEDSDADKVAAIMAARAQGTGIRRIARDLGVGVGTVLRVTGEIAGSPISRRGEWRRSGPSIWPRRWRRHAE
jgi:hypothetical protein